MSAVDSFSLSLPLCHTGVMLQRFEFTKVCVGENVKRHFNRNCDIFFSKNDILRRGNSKSDKSLKRLRIALKSKRTKEKTTRH